MRYELVGWAGADNHFFDLLAKFPARRRAMIVAGNIEAAMR